MAADRVAALVSLARTDGYDAALRHWARSAMEYVERVGYLTSTELTHIHAQVGELDEAIRWLERAVDDHTRDLIYLNVEPGFDVLRALPRFADLASQVIG